MKRLAESLKTKDSPDGAQSKWRMNGTRVAWMLFLSLFIFHFSPAKANDYLEKDKHYMAYANGADKVHFVIPVWAYGKSYDYYAYDDNKCSYIAYKKNGSSDWVTVAKYKTDAYDENENKNSKKGTAYVWPVFEQGTIIVTSMATGVDKRLTNSGSWSEKLYVTQKEDDDCPQVTMLEIDWYPPQSLDNTEYQVKIVSEFRRSYTKGNAMTCETTYSGFMGANNMMTPQLYTPYIYQVNEGGPTGYGYAAIPYMTFNDPVSYTTSLSSQVENISSRGGTLYVMTNDTVQEKFSATFTLWRNQANNDAVTITSTSVDIPPYHRFYNLGVIEEKDSTGTFTGNNVLSWDVRNPGLKDLVDGDYFEIQRALESDYSDASTIELVQFSRNPDKTQYSYTDMSRDTWTGNASVSDVTKPAHFVTRKNHYVVYDSNGEPLAEIDASLHAYDVVLPGVPVYYRVRRASSSVWGWEHDFAKKASLIKHNFLAPLAETQQPYTLDANYQNNHQVHFRLHIENKEVADKPTIIKDSCKLTYSLNKVLKQGNMGLTLLFEQGRWCNNPEGQTQFRVTDSDGKLIHDWKVLTAGTYFYPINSTLQVKNVDSESYNANKISTFKLYADSKIRCATDWRMATQEFFVYFTSDGDGSDDFIQELEPYMSAVKDSLYNMMQHENNSTSYGRCMWDRTAQLILTRTIEEMGQNVEFVIPQDSIVRQEDGSWIASFTDVADKACSHYKYSVRIDQSKSDLHVQYSSSLDPIQLTGPSLYFDEGASIREMIVSQGDASTELKSGVLVRWQTNTNNYDDFVLLRQVKNSSDAADTLIVTTESNYFDRSAVPDMHYDYTVVARYDCNGRHTTNSATAEGWRTPYGEISGSILMPDNTGMAGVTVALQDGDGQTISTMTTDAGGAYKFDSLEYSKVECEEPDFTVKLFNITYPSTIMVRILDADGNVLQDWTNRQGGTYSYPVGTVIEAKTTYQSDQSYNVVNTFVISQKKHYQLYASATKMIGRPMRTSFSLSEISDCTCSAPQESFSVIPTHQYGTFSFNNTSSGTATVTLSQDNAVASGIDFVNTSTTRLTGRVLYKNSTIPVAGAMFLLNGDTVRRGSDPLTSAINGNFELVVPLSQTCKLQVFKTGHTFEGDGILRVEQDMDSFALSKPLDGVRFYDETKVRLVGRVAGGNDQRDLPHGFGLGKNNLGDNLQLVLQLEGDNTAHFVFDPNDQTLDTIKQTTPHVIYSTDPLAVEKERVTGNTHTTFEKKRIIINPDPETGEFAVDLFPVKYKVVQATANGYATLFGAEQGSETFNLTDAPLTDYNALYNKSDKSVHLSVADMSSLGNRLEVEVTKVQTDTALYNGDSIHYNAVYDRIYHTPMQISLNQMIYGLQRAGLGEPSMEVSHINPSLVGTVDLYRKQADGTIDYLLDYPVFIGGRKYQFTAEAYEDYYYNNDHEGGKLDRVPLRGGSVTIHNGLHNSKSETYALDLTGRNQSIWLMADNYDVNNVGTDALRTVSAALEQEGNIVETTLFSGYITGTVVQEKDLRMTDSEIVLLDIIRDPGGAGSSAWVESGSTYSYSYKTSYKWETGLNLQLKYGLNVSSDIGIVSAPQGVGSYTGSTYTTSKQFSFPIPITHSWDWGYQYDYTITTNERISTSSSSTPKGVGAMADVFFGTTVSQIAGKAKTVSIIGDSLFRMRQPAFDAGAMRKIAEGTDSVGNKFYLVTGQKIVLGSTLDNTFAYTQHYILNTLLPELAMERQNLLVQFPSKEDALATAKATGEEVYWYHPKGGITNQTDTLPRSYYEMITPDDDHVYTDRVAALNNMLLQWTTVLYNNEKEKVMARGSSTAKVGSYSVSYGATVSHSDAYTAAVNYNEVPQGWDMIAYDAEKTATKAGQSALQTIAANVKDFWGTRNGTTFGTSAAEALNNYYKDVYDWASREDESGFEDVTGEAGKEMKKPEELGTVTNSSKFSMSIEPVLNFESDNRSTDVKTNRKSAGFNIVSDPDGDITVSVYRVLLDSIWQNNSQVVRDNLSILNDDSESLYGSYVFVTDAGATFCPHEDAQLTQFYNPGMNIGNATQWIVKPEMTANTYEITNVQPENSAYFQVILMNNSEVDTGIANEGHALTLMLDGESNPDGAVVTVDGMPLTQGINYWIVPGRPLTKTVRVERGTVDDYENLTLMLYATDCMKTLSNMNLSVHFLPVSSDVSIAMPRQNWVMNTLSQQDSTGYYLPVEIDGFDIHHKNFDHIEFQYKLSTESEEMWVNQCSFYASDSLYALATGNKALIRNGRIEPFRFYGERDPMEQRYDLRAVSFCRYGSGFVTKSSPVISGTKDTRPPRVFGEPEPANSILGVGDNLRLRFNEPIAGNYLDEDNNFQIKGVTNATGITTNASVHFDGSFDSYATSMVNRSLSGRSFTIDMLVKPAAQNREYVFFDHGLDGAGVRFGLTADNCLVLQFGTIAIYSKPLETMLDFTRVCVTYNNETNEIRFFAGTQDVTDPNARKLPTAMNYDVSAPLVFGRAFEGNMLELRLWSKALTQEEIAATHMRYLTGYERELVAYYPMTEGQGNTLTDKAGGATLLMHGATWNLPKGISLAIKAGEQVQLNGNLLGRSKVYDETLMLWFRPTSTNGDVFKAGHDKGTKMEQTVVDRDTIRDTINYEVGTLLAIENGNLVLHSDSNQWSLGAVGQNEWNHFVLTVNRTYNNVSAFVNGKMTASFAATELAGISGAMYLGGNGFEGNVDEFVIFEQALPKTLVEEYGNHSPAGDEMGLMAYLPFEEQKLNANGVLELVFSPNDQRVFYDPNGNVVEKEVSLIVESQKSKVESMADKTAYAPVTGSALLSKLNFDWAFNQDELLINLLMQDREINKQTVVVTVRDVEDLNGNPMPSPVMWVAYVDRNSVTWNNNKMELWVSYGSTSEDNYSYRDMRIVNNSGKRHQFTIESLPDWLSVNQPYGTIQPIDDYTVRFTYDTTLPVGTYTDMVYVTDENGLSEPLKVIMYVEARCPWNEPDASKYALNMSLCGQVLIDGEYDTDSNDKVIALYRNECVGMANVAFSNLTNKSEVYMTVYGNEAMNNKSITFQLWQASTGKMINLVPSEQIRFAHGNVYGCGQTEPVVFTAGGSEVQNISLQPGWNWTSFNINVNADKTGVINNVMTASDPWTEGDLIKNPVTRNFCTYSDSLEQFVGSLYHFRYIYTHMVYCKEGNTMRVTGRRLPQDSMRVTLRGGGQWSPLPCLYAESTPIAEALADYLDNATPGDLLKSHDRFAVFSEDRRWVGDLTAIRPGEGYFLRRMGAGDVTIRFYNTPAAAAPQKAPAFQGNGATTMTIIATVEGDGLKAYLDDELVGVAMQIDSLYFLTISTDNMGELRFTTEDGTPLVSEMPITYAADAHHGSLKAPVILKPSDPDRVRKVIEDNHVIIIRGGERYDVTGKKLNK
ncbi:MAG: hypothetical protein IJ776_04075 [Paludibacteraceae bacterium]|nr:hypothetical protein [Paludibacteraceae bacterium]